ncbi:MAG: alpha,alpha-trehalase [Clostridia bacterium]|nr:alpha,alpha-trehalase [Clostridia bacterium]
MNTEIKKFLDENIKKTVKVSKESNGTLLGLPCPYTTPCVSDGYQEIYYWDTYFTNAGLLLWDNTEYVKNNIENMFYLVEKYGFMPNGNRTYYLNRSQPPFLSQMVRDLYDVTADRVWLARAYEVLKKEYSFWQTKRITPTGLNGNTGYDIVEDVLESNYKYFLRRIGQPAKSEPTREDLLYAYMGGVSVYESGWDCNSRVKDRGHLFDMADLNSLLFGMEENMRFFAAELKNGEDAAWEKRAAERKEKMQFLWNTERGLFMDRNFETGEFSDYASAASFYPMYVGLASKEQARETMRLFDDLNLKYGISAGESKTQWNCQWDYPNVWAPIQFIMYKALKKYGYENEAKTVARKYVDTVESNFKKTANFWEKYDGNTGERAGAEYKAEPMLGWTAGVYIFFNHELGLLN